MSTLSVGTIRSNTSAPPVIQNTSGTEIGTYCRAWVNFNGTTVTNPGSMTGVRASFNVSSVTDNGTGDYTVSFTNAMPDANYSVVYTADSFSSRTGLAAPSTTAVRVDNRNNSNVATDPTYANVAIFR